ncbi:MAG TPA: sulfite exporter TauE/SafE family protein [Polyangiales bacterium]|jgi:sulfite exporter TauE/SafE|nr:sulfite exporter TauE/SafE family protein [Polyangiales bacterium]
MLQDVITGALLGVFALPHCALMCGPLASAACSRNSRSAPLRYQLGRTAGYALAGFASGQLGRVIGVAAPSPFTIMFFSLLSALACLYVARSFLRAGQPNVELVTLGTAPRSRVRTGLLARVLPKEPLALGALSALLPCGVLGAALVSAVATASGERGALLMLGFVTSSGVALVTASAVMRLVPRASDGLRRFAAGALVVLAIVSVGRPLHAYVSARASGVAHPVMHCH